MATNGTPSLVRRLVPAEVTGLLNHPLPAFLATLDPAGFPRVLPIWFLWEDGSFYLSSAPQSRHVQDLAHDSHAGLTLAVEEGQTPMGYRPFRQIMVRGKAQILPDTDAVWAQKLIRKYIVGDAAVQRAKLEEEKSHVVIVLRPERFLTTGFFPNA